MRGTVDGSTVAELPPILKSRGEAVSLSFSEVCFPFFQDAHRSARPTFLPSQHNSTVEKDTHGKSDKSDLHATHAQ